MKPRESKAHNPEPLEITVSGVRFKVYLREAKWASKDRGLVVDLMEPMDPMPPEISIGARPRAKLSKELKAALADATGRRVTVGPGVIDWR